MTFHDFFARLSDALEKMFELRCKLPLFSEIKIVCLTAPKRETAHISATIFFISQAILSVTFGTRERKERKINVSPAFFAKLGGIKATGSGFMSLQKKKFLFLTWMTQFVDLSFCLFDGGHLMASMNIARTYDITWERLVTFGKSNKGLSAVGVNPNLYLLSLSPLFSLSFSLSCVFL